MSQSLREPAQNALLTTGRLLVLIILLLLSLSLFLFSAQGALHLGSDPYLPFRLCISALLHRKT